MTDPRFPGGTGGAVAAEMRALAPVCDLSLVALATAMFKGRRLNPAIEAALEDLGLAPCWNPAVVHADTLVFHNPSCLRFDRTLDVRLSCAEAFVVTHENFLRPGGAEGFDVGKCLGLIEEALVSGRRWLAPISSHNRETVSDWIRQAGSDWVCTAQDWFNVIDAPLVAPVAAPRDRRGRHSRPGPEKYPPREALLRQFPPHAERCILLGADSLMKDGEEIPRHWDLRAFGTSDVGRFLGEIDFFVYFTHPLWRESFGRVIAEAIAAGKLVVTDPDTARTFGSAVIASDGSDIDRIVAEYVSQPARYGAFVRRAQETLARFGAEAFRERFSTLVHKGQGAAFDLV